MRQSPEQRRTLLEFAAAEYQAGRSLRELAELTGRTQTAIRRALDQAGVPRARERPGEAGAGPDEPSPSGPMRHRRWFLT